MSQGVERVCLRNPTSGMQVIELQGFPARFWVVTQPTTESELGDFCFECNILEFACQIRGGLRVGTIVGCYNDEKTTRHKSQELLDARG